MAETLEKSVCSSPTYVTYLGEEKGKKCETKGRETEIVSKVQDKRSGFIMREGFSGCNFDFLISRGCFVRSSKIGTNVGANVLFTRGRNHIQTVISLESGWR
ncbi:hypothetical protein RUM43_009565 [Polyplax serrata]|uniref:Uncharacterized protein n=1 Tax=Polyplax serrata TaxID=468196 RepID=A0AAN8PAY3_POLSC